MSIQAVGWVLDFSESTGNDRLVMISLANHADEGRITWPSVNTICREARVSRATTFRSLDRLREQGEIARVAESQLDSRQSERFARIRADRRPVIYRLTGSQIDTSSNHGVSLEPERGLTNGTHGVSLVRPEPSIEPSTLNREISSLSWAAEQTTGWVPDNPQCKNSQCVNGWVESDRGLVPCEVCNEAMRDVFLVEAK